MSRAGHFIVSDSEGVRGTFQNLPSRDESAAGAVVTVDVGRGQRWLEVPSRALVEGEDGTFFFPGRFAELAGANPSHGAQADAGSRPTSLLVPVVEEELQLGKRWVEAGGVRVTKQVHEREEVVDEPLLREEIEVERVPVNRVVDGPVEVRHEGDVMIVPVLEEVLVTEKRLVLKEELRITRRRVEARDPQRVTLRAEEVSVEHFGGRRQDEGDDDKGRSQSAARPNK